jgi:hypothetical protein
MERDIYIMIGRGRGEGGREIEIESVEDGGKREI